MQTIWFYPLTFIKAKKKLCFNFLLPLEICPKLLQAGTVYGITLKHVYLSQYELCFNFLLPLEICPKLLQAGITGKIGFTRRKKLKQKHNMC
jgi:hypothetical protein